MIMGSRVRIRLVHHFQILISRPLFWKNSKPGVHDRGHRLRSGSPVTIYPPAAPCVTVKPERFKTRAAQRRTFLYGAMRELVCNGQLWARAPLRQFHSYTLQGRIARALSNSSLVNNMEMMAAIQYILTAAQSLRSQDYFKKSRILGLAGVSFCENEQA